MSVASAIVGRDAWKMSESPTSTGNCLSFDRIT